MQSSQLDVNQKGDCKKRLFPSVSRHDYLYWYKLGQAPSSIAAVAFDFLHWRASRDAQVGRDPTSPTLNDCWTVVCYELIRVGMEP